MKYYEKLRKYIRAGYTGLLIETVEEARVEDEILKAAERFSDVKVLVWSITRGLMKEDDGKLVAVEDSQPDEVFKHVEKLGDDLLVIMRDFHPYLVDPIVVRSCRDAMTVAKRTRTTYIFISPEMKLPADLSAEIHSIDFELPDAEALGEVLGALIEVNKKKVHKETREAAVDAARGLTTLEAENVFSLALGNGGGLEPLTIAKEKASVIKRSGSLELYDATEEMDNVGGLTCLKDWLSLRKRSFTKEARDFGLPEPRGMLLVGVPGSGKSLVAKAVASAWQKPLLRFDVGAIFGSLVGESEAGMRRAIATAEAVAPCILWIDEIEKAFAGVGNSGSNDSGVTARVFGTLLTWMQEKKSPVFVCATANKIAALPPELLRKGRFDEIFFVDLPSEEERRDIFKIHLDKRNRKLKEAEVKGLAALAKDFSGAEIEETIIAALYTAFNDDARKLSVDDVGAAIEETVPLAKMSEGEIDKLRSWAEGHARYASPREATEINTKGRRIRA